MDDAEIRLRLIEAAAKTPAATHSGAEMISERVQFVANQWFEWVRKAPQAPVVSSEVRPSVADKPKRPA